MMCVCMYVQDIPACTCHVMEFISMTTTMYTTNMLPTAPAPLLQKIPRTPSSGSPESPGPQRARGPCHRQGREHAKEDHVRVWNQNHYLKVSIGREGGREGGMEGGREGGREGGSDGEG